MKWFLPLNSCMFLGSIWFLSDRKKEKQKPDYDYAIHKDTSKSQLGCTLLHTSCSLLPNVEGTQLLYGVT